jgi:hypothetical protein
MKWYEVRREEARLKVQGSRKLIINIEHRLTIYDLRSQIKNQHSLIDIVFGEFVR